MNYKQILAEFLHDNHIEDIELRPLLELLYSDRVKYRTQISTLEYCLNRTPELNSIIYELNNITPDCTEICDSFNIFNSHTVFKSSNIRYSKGINSSTNVDNSFGVLNSTNISDSCAIGTSEDISNGLYIGGCHKVVNSAFCELCNDCSNILFTVGRVNAHNHIFDEEVDDFTFTYWLLQVTAQVEKYGGEFYHFYSWSNLPYLRHYKYYYGRLHPDFWKWVLDYVPGATIEKIKKFINPKFDFS